MATHASSNKGKKSDENLSKAHENRGNAGVDDMDDPENDYHCYYCKEEFQSEKKLKLHTCDGSETLIDEGNTWMG